VFFADVGLVPAIHNIYTNTYPIPEMVA